MIIKSQNERITLEVLPFGLTVHKLLIKSNDGSLIDIIPGPENAQDHKESRTFLHTIIGRYTNRVPVDNHKIASGAVVHPEPVESEIVSHHGGIDAFDRKTFDAITLAQSQLYGDKDIPENFTFQLFKLVSDDGENGYPGKMLVEAAFFVSDGSVILTHRAKMLDDKPCPINLTQHWGFNLTADKIRSSTIGDHLLYLNSKSIAETSDSSNLALGSKVDIDGTPFDFNKLRKINEKEIIQDHYYFFNRDGSKIDRTIAQSENDIISAQSIANDKQETQLLLKSDEISLHFTTNQSGVMFYAGGGFDESAPRRKTCHEDVNNKNAAYPKNGCAFFEFHHPLSTFLHKEYQEDAKTTTILNKDEGNIYQNWVKIDIA
ncbi:galactose mutarotase-like protein [Wallemia mellicola]|nr:galactose mutarotase-like protein [Wallemia mellicola]TIC42477.1 galactose mutarotase-like protein [Wallemia mellicola]